MSAEWNRGVLTTSSWHRLEDVKSMGTAAEMIEAGTGSGAWPASVQLETMRTEGGLLVPGKAVVATYGDGTRKAHGAVGSRYHPLDTKEWRATVEAAVRAGAKPAGAFSLRGGARVLATFEIPGGNDGSGLRNYFNLVDSLDGSIAHLTGGSTIRIVCANTLAAAMGQLKGEGVSIRHTSSINDRTRILRSAIEEHVKGGEKIRDLYKTARETKLARDDADAIWEALFPRPTEEIRKESPAKATRMTNARADFARATKRGENYEGQTLATLWNGATWLVDRTADGQGKPSRSGDELDSLLFGTRGKRVEEIRNVVEVVLRDGTTALMEATEAKTHGIDDAQIGRSLLGEML